MCFKVCLLDIPANLLRSLFIIELALKWHVMMFWWDFLVNWAEPGVASKRELKLRVSACPVATSVRACADWWYSPQASCLPTHIGLGCVRKLGKHKQRAKQRVSQKQEALFLQSFYFELLPLTFLNDALWPGSISQLSPVLHKFSHNNWKATRTHDDVKFVLSITSFQIFFK